MLEGVLADVDTSFCVDACSLAPHGGDHIKANVINPSGQAQPAQVTDEGLGTYSVVYAPIEKGSLSFIFICPGCNKVGVFLH